MRSLAVLAAFAVALPAVAAPEAPPQSGVRTEAEAQKQVAPSGKAHITHLAEGRNAYVGKLVVEAGAAIPEHADDSEEYIHVLEGTGTITIDGEAKKVGPGDTVFMAAKAKVSYQNGPARMVAIQVFAGPESAVKYQSWKAAPAK